MSHKIAIITDSTCDLPKEWITNYDISIVPMTVIINSELYLDGIDIDASTLYRRIRQERCQLNTSQPTPQQFLKAYQEAQTKGAESILAITISSFSSGTYSSAQQAAQGFPLPIHIIDSHNNSMGLGWQVLAAAREREKGADMDTIIRAVMKVQKEMVYYVSLNTIEYLQKGGRINEAVKFLNSILNIKPLVYVKPESGLVGASLPSRSRKAAIENLYKEFFRHINPQKSLHIAVLHNDALSEAQELADRVQREYSPAELITCIVTPILGVHTGPDAIALCGYAD